VVKTASWEDQTAKFNYERATIVNRFDDKVKVLMGHCEILLNQKPPYIKNMKKLPLLRIIAFALIGITAISCKKDKDKGSSCATDVASISGSYKFTAYTYKQTPSSPEEDWLPIIFSDACERDDVLSFNSGGNYVVTDAGIVCSPAGGDSGNWSLSGSTMNIDGDPTTIESFDCKTLVLVNSDVNVTGDKLKITLTKQ